MSQAGQVALTSGNLPPNVPTTFTEDTGSAVPAANNLNIFGNDSTTNNNNGITTTGSGSTVTVLITNRLQGSANTTNAGTADLVTFPLSATPGAYRIEAHVVGFDPVTPSYSSYTILGLVGSTGVAAAIIGTPDETPIESLDMLTSDIDFVASANTFIIRAFGVAGKTIHWDVVATYEFIS